MQALRKAWENPLPPRGVREPAGESAQGPDSRHSCEGRNLIFFSFNLVRYHFEVPAHCLRK